MHDDSYYWSQQVLIEEEIGEAQGYWDSTDLNPLDQQDYLAADNSAYIPWWIL